MTVPRTCESVRRLLPDFIDRELPVGDADAVLDHLVACAACRTAHDAEQEALDVIRRRVRAVRMPPGARARLLAALDEASRSMRSVTDM